ncbi:MAG: MBL fold metallo-hydrolase [Chloroflexi bacterium]|nr:MBL fold metallo-hydrolase [Chloroflexota bacterium]
MKIGKMEVCLLSDGVFKLDGGVLFGQVPKVVWERKVKPDRRNRVLLGLNSLLILSADGNILVDTGVGTKVSDTQKEIYGLGNTKLLKNLRDIGLSPRDIRTVILSHLHFDHCGGSTRQNRRGEMVPTFPKAQYLVQRAAWDDASQPNERGKASFHQDDFQPLLGREQMELLDGDKEVASGVFLKVTNGHCRGHQMVLVNHGGTKMAFLGDLVPTPHHLALPYITALDQFPEETLEQKRELLKTAEREGWLIVFAHGHDQRAGYLERRDGRLCLRPVTL